MISPADTAWMLTSTALVLLMTPALAFFYGGLVGAKNVLNTMMMSIIALGFIGVLWAVIGYSLAFGTGIELDRRHVVSVPARRRPRGASGSIPHLLFMSYQATFAIITAALISGAVIGRMRFSAYVGVHQPVGARRLQPDRALGLGRRLARARWARSTSPAAPWSTSTRAPPRWWRRWSSARAADYPQRRSCCRTTCRSRCSAPACCGSAGSASMPAARSRPTRAPALAFTTTLLAPAATLVVWTLLDAVRTRKPTAVGAATAIVVGLVAITPAAGYIGPMSALILGGLAAIPSYYGLQWRAKTSLDDSLDVVAAHGVGGTVGALLTGVFAQKALNGVSRRPAVRQPRAAGHPGHRGRWPRSSTAAS